MLFDLPAGRPFDVVGLGLNAVDLFAQVPRLPEPDEKLAAAAPFSRSPGGQVATALVACARMGLSCRYLGKVGEDEAGQFSRRSLAEEGIDISRMDVVPGAATQQAMILIDGRSGERTIVYHRDDRTRFEPGDYGADEIGAGRVLHLDGHKELACSIEAARRAREAGMAVVMDAEKVVEGTAELLPHVDFLLASEKFPRRFTGIDDPEQALARLAEGPHRLVAMTLGRRGSLAIVDGHTIYSHGYRVEAVDTTGAGDVFHGAFIVGLVRGWEVARVLAFANACAALSCTAIGGRNGIPTEAAALALVGRG